MSNVWKSHRGPIAGALAGAGFIFLLVIIYLCRNKCKLTRKSPLRSQGRVIAPPSGISQQEVYTVGTAVGAPIMSSCYHPCQAQVQCSTLIPGGQWHTTSVYHPCPGANTGGPSQRPTNESTPSHRSYPQPSAPPSTSIGTETGYTRRSPNISITSGNVSASSPSAGRSENSDLPPSYQEAVHAQTPSAPSMVTRPRRLGRDSIT